MALQLLANLLQFSVCVRHFISELSDRLRCADTSHNVFTLGVDEVLTVEHLFTIGRVTRESHTRGTGVTHVAEDHGLDVNSRTPLRRNVVLLAVDYCALVAP